MVVGYGNDISPLVYPLFRWRSSSSSSSCQAEGLYHSLPLPPHTTSPCLFMHACMQGAQQQLAEAVGRGDIFRTRLQVWMRGGGVCVKVWGGTGLRGHLPYMRRLQVWMRGEGGGEVWMWGSRERWEDQAAILGEGACLVQSTSLPAAGGGVRR